MRILPVLICPVLICPATAGEKKAPQGHAEDDSVSITATVVSPEQVKQMFGTDFDNNYTVLEVMIAPKDGKPYAVRLDDFILRSESSLDHSGPFAAGQIAGAGAVIVERKYGDRSNADSPRPITGTEVHIQDDATANPALAALKKNILIEKTTAEPESGLLFFPLSKEKPKNLVLSYKSTVSRLRLTFK
jgi:hypothetical protein